MSLDRPFDLLGLLGVVLVGVVQRHLQLVDVSLCDKAISMRQVQNYGSAELSTRGRREEVGYRDASHPKISKTGNAI